MNRGTVKRLTVFFMAITNCCCEIFCNLRLPLRVERAQRPNRLGSTFPGAAQSVSELFDGKTLTGARRRAAKCLGSFFAAAIESR
jgi:hypothetical protein